MPPDGGRRHLAAIFSADGVGYSRLMAADETATLRALDSARDEMGERIGAQGGRIVDAVGDNLLAEFPSVVEAVSCAVEIQRELAARQEGVPAERQLLFRIGINLGDVIAEGGRLVGDGVNVAARLERLAEPGGLCISGPAFDQVEGKLPLEFEDLGEHAVKNIPRPVRVYRVGTGSEAQLPAAASERTRPGVSRLVAAVFAALAVVAVVAALLLRPTATPGRPRIESLAVLPLDNLSGDPEQEFFADGMTEALITTLAQVGTLRIISRTSVMRYKGLVKSLPEIARELDVDAIVEGSVLRSGDRVRITAQLIHAESDGHLWAESYERDASDVLRLQSEVARAIAGEVELTISPSQEQRLASAPSILPEAHEAYLRGRSHWNKRTAENNSKARDYFERATLLAPQYAAAHAGLADTYILMAVGYDVMGAHEAMRRGKEAALRALEIDDSLAEAHTSLAGVKLFYDWEFEAAEREFERALRANPSYAPARHWYSILLVATGRGEEAIRHAQIAQRLDPLSPIVNANLGWVYLDLREYEAAIAELSKALDLEPDFAPALNWLGRSFSLRGDYGAAIAHYERSKDFGGWSRANLGYAFARSGEGQRARQIIAQLSDQPPGGYIPAFQIARVYTGLDEPEEAFRWLETAYEERAGWMVMLAVTPELDTLRADPRFADLERRVGLRP